MTEWANATTHPAPHEHDFAPRARGARISWPASHRHIPRPSARQSARDAAPSPDEVTVLFSNMVLTFSMPGGATLLDLVTRLGDVSASPKRRIVGVAIKLSHHTVKSGLDRWSPDATH